MSDPTFFARGACRGMDPNIFFPGPGDASYTNQARTVCAGCPVSDACLEWALAEGEWKGIWGGLTAKARRDLARSRGNTRRQEKQSCGTPAGYRRHWKQDGKVTCTPCLTARATYENARRHPDSNAA